MGPSGRHAGKQVKPLPAMTPFTRALLRVRLFLELRTLVCDTLCRLGVWQTHLDCIPKVFLGRAVKSQGFKTRERVLPFGEVELRGKG